MTPLCVVKSEDSNEFTLTLGLSPNGLTIYTKVSWVTAFATQQFGLTPSSASYDSSSNRLRVTFGYNSDLRDTPVSVSAVPSPLVAQFGSLPSVSLSVPNTIENNLALALYSDEDYRYFKIVKYLSITLSSLALLLYFVGFFGVKLIALESIAVFQLSALLTVSLQPMAPAISGLTYLRISMGVIPLPNSYIYEASNINPNFKALLISRDSSVCLNVLSVVFLIPFVVGIVLRIVSLF